MPRVSILTCSKNVGSTTVGYSLRNANDIRTVNANAQLYFNSFIPSVIRELNELPRHVQDSPTLLTFKNHLNSDISSSPSYYYTGNRPSQTYHIRVRTHCSALYQHLFSKSIIPSSLCDCGGVENVRHFLLECAVYQDIHRDMLVVISPICTPDLNTLVYGNPEAANDDNIVSFKGVQMFISKIKRFNQWFRKCLWPKMTLYVLFNVLITLTTDTLVTKLLTKLLSSPWSRDFLYGMDKVRCCCCFFGLFFFFIFSFIHVLIQLVVAIHIYYLIPKLLKYFISTWMSIL